LQAVVDDKLRLQIPFLGGVDEQSEVLEQKPEEFLSSQGLFPQFTGMLARMPGKIAIRKEASPVRSIHQSFSGASFGFYVESDRLVFFNDCANPRYTVKPAPPASLGTDAEGFTLDVFGGASKGLGVPITVPALNFHPHCIPTTQEEGPPPTLGSGIYILLTEFINDTGSNRALILGFYHGGTIDSSYQVEEGVDFEVGVGKSFDFSAYVALEKVGLERIYITEASANTPIEIVSTTPTDAVEGVDASAIGLTSGNAWDKVDATLQIGRLEGEPPKQYLLFTNGSLGGADISVDWVYSGHSGSDIIPGPTFVNGVDFTQGAELDFTDAVKANEFNEVGLTLIIFYKGSGPSRVKLPISIILNKPYPTFMQPFVVGMFEGVPCQLLEGEALVDWGSSTVHLNH
jgi:hypothetical protein